MNEIKKYKNLIFELLFALSFILSCLTMNSNNLKGYSKAQGIAFIVYRAVLIIIVLAYLSAKNQNNINFVSKFVKLLLWILTPFVVFDYYVTNISGSIFLFKVWWIAYIMTASAAVFVTITLFRVDNYKLFYNSFWQGFTPIYLFTLYIGFLRKPNTNLTTNFKLGNGTFKMLAAILKKPNIDFEPYLLFFGNVIIFLPLPFILSAFFKNVKTYQLAIIGFLAPFIAEGYQYFFKCGDVDIDDIILNWLGYFIGMGIYLIIKKRLLTKSE